MDLMLPILAVLAACGAGAWWLLRRRAGPREQKRALDGLDTVTDWPPQATRILTTQERLAHGILVRALPEYLIFAQVPLARFLRVPTRNSYSEWLRRLGSQCADLVVCDSASQVIAVVDVQAPADQTSERGAKRVKRMRRVLKAAGVPLHVWTENFLPTVAAAREAVLQAPAAPMTSGAAAPAKVAVARPARPAFEETNPLDDSERDSSDDEVIEAREPPPSTWFDEFNSGPTPLAKSPKRKK
jgi:hypothetical protein